jgi:hypothetical protein
MGETGSPAVMSSRNSAHAEKIADELKDQRDVHGHEAAQQVECVPSGRVQPKPVCFGAVLRRLLAGLGQVGRRGQFGDHIEQVV